MTLYVVVPKQGDAFAIEAETMEYTAGAVLFRRDNEPFGPTAVVALDSVIGIFDRAYYPITDKEKFQPPAEG